MKYTIERQIFAGFAYHPQNRVEQWEYLCEKNSEQQAVEYITNLCKTHKGKYRVRDYKGKVVININN